MNVVIPRPNPNGELSAGIGKVCGSFVTHLSSQFVGSMLVVCMCCIYHVPQTIVILNF